MAARPWRPATEKAKENEFASAFWAAGHFYRTPEPNRVYYFSHFVDLANERLAMIDREAVDGNAFLVACVAHADVVYQRPDRMLGAVLEVGLNEHAGRPCSNAWRKVLTGEALLLKPVARGNWRVKPSRRLGLAHRPGGGAASGRKFRRRMAMRPPAANLTGGGERLGAVTEIVVMKMRSRRILLLCRRRSHRPRPTDSGRDPRAGGRGELHGTVRRPRTKFQGSWASAGHD